MRITCIRLVFLVGAVVAAGCSTSEDAVTSFATEAPSDAPSVESEAPSDAPSVDEMVQAVEEIGDVVTEGDLREQAEDLAAMDVDDRLGRIRRNVKSYYEDELGMSSEVFDWSNEKLLKLADAACEAVTDAENLEQFSMALSVVAVGFDVFTYNDQVALGGMSGALIGGFCSEQGERLGLFELLAEPGSALDGSQFGTSDNMNRGDGPFIAESDPNVTLVYEDGGYSMKLNSIDDPTGNWETARALYQRAVRNIRVEASFDVRDHTSEWSVGIGCVAGGNYFLFITSVGFAHIVVEDYATASSSLLAERSTDERSAGRIALECRGGGDEPTELVGFVDGDEVIRTSDPSGWDSFHGMAVSAAVPPNATIDVLWDDPFAGEL